MPNRELRMLLAPEEVDDPVDFPVSRSKLANLVREKQALAEEVEKLREENRRLREEKARSRAKSAALKSALDRLRTSLSVLGTDAKTAAAVGVPSSRVFFRQPPPPPDRHRSTGGQPGHPGTTRPRATPNRPPKVLALTECPKCTHPLGAPCDEWRRPVTDLPEPGLDIFDLVIPRYKCRGCGERVHAPIPEAYRGEFGPRLKAFVAELRVLGMPFEKVAELLRMRYGLEVSVATLIAMEEGVAESLDPIYRDLTEEMRDAKRTPNAQGDETGMPVGGRTEWLWVGTSPTATVYHIQAGRGGKEAAAMWSGFEGTLTHDGLDAYNAVTGADHQFDLVHGNRWLQKVEAADGIEPRGFRREDPPRYTRAGHPPTEFLEFAAGVRARWRAEVAWVERHPRASTAAREWEYRRAVRSMGRFLAREWEDTDAARIADELGQRLRSQFTFVRTPGVSWNSNEAEREVRVAVVHRKVSGGRRTARGTWVLERLLTVWRTCAKREGRFWEAVAEALGALPRAGPGPPSGRPAS